MKALRILILRVGAMGDVLHALPAVAALRTIRPEWKVDWVVDPRWAALLVNSRGKGPIVSRAHLADTKLWTSAPTSRATLLSIRDLGQTLKREHYDVVVDMQGTLRSAVIGRMAGAPEFAGYSDPREALARRLYKQKLVRLGTHVVEQGASLLSSACGVPLTPGAVELPRDSEAEAWAATIAGTRPLCMLAPNAGWAAKRWPEECFAELARELNGVGFDVVVNAAGNDDPVAARVLELSEGAARVVSPNIAGLVALTRRAALFVGGDSGPMHLAAALQIPTVALFGPTDPGRNGPWGPGAHRVLRHASSVTSYKRLDTMESGLSRIPIQSVLGAAEDVLSAPSRNEKG